MTTDDRISTLEQAVRKANGAIVFLEKKNKRSRVVAAMALGVAVLSIALLVVAQLLLAASPGGSRLDGTFEARLADLENDRKHPGTRDKIRARIIELVDDDGKSTITMAGGNQTGLLVIHNGPNGLMTIGGGLILASDNSGNPLYSLSGIDRTGIVRTFGPGGKELVTLTATEGGQGAIFTQSADGKGLVSIIATDAGEGVIITQNADGKDLVSITATKGGDGMIITSNADGKELVTLTATDGGNGMITTKNTDGKELVSLTATKGGQGGAIFTQSADGKELVSITAMKDGDGGAISVLNKAGAEVCTLSVDEYGHGEIGVWDRDGKGRTLTPGP